MTEKEEKEPLSPAMLSALQAVARMKGDAAPDAALWADFLDALGCFAGRESGPQEKAEPTEE